MMKPQTYCRKHTLTREMRQIAKSYSEALTFLNTHFSPFNDEQKTDEYERYVLKVRTAYLKLDGLEQRFINNEFFTNDDPSWWVRFYTRATFYRIRLQSIKHFKEIFDNEN